MVQTHVIPGSGGVVLNLPGSSPCLNMNFSSMALNQYVSPPPRTLQFRSLTERGITGLPSISIT